MYTPTFSSDSPPPGTHCRLRTDTATPHRRIVAPLIRDERIGRPA